MIQTQCLELFVSCIPVTAFAQGWFLHFIIIWYNLNNLQTTIKNYRNNRKRVIVKINNVPVQLHTLACSDCYPNATHEICWKWMKMISIKRTHQTTAVPNRPGYFCVPGLREISEIQGIPGLSRWSNDVSIVFPLDLSLLQGLGRTNHCRIICLRAPKKKTGGTWHFGFLHLGVSENSVPLNPMVNDHYPY